jgi:hypothetical protein
MTIWCKIEGGVIATRVNVTKPPKDIADGPDGFPVWRPFIKVSQPAYDSETHHAPVQTQGSGIGESVTPGPDITQAWAAPVAKTAPEIDAELDALVDAIDGNRSLLKGLARVVFKIAKGDFAIPNGSLTLDQFKAQIKTGAQE